MNSTNNTKVKDGNEFDIRDVLNFILGKLWIVLLAMLCFAVIAVVLSGVKTREYTSRAELFITQSTNANSISPTDITTGKQLAITAPSLVTLTFCDKVAEEINTNNSIFVEKYGNITGAQILSCISASTNEETSIVTFTATTKNPEFSRDLVNVVTEYFRTYIVTFMYPNIDLNDQDAMEKISIRTMVSSAGVANYSPSNVHTVRDAFLAAVVGAVLAIAVLVIIFMFDDKIKTPDDIEKYLNISVLGVIPEIETE